jgi:hypothetical protein
VIGVAIDERDLVLNGRLALTSVTSVILHRIGAPLSHAATADGQPL